MYLEARRVKKLSQGSEDLQFCYDMLNRVSRSFSIVIQQLPEQLRDAVCVFYLVLRALDTVEDDMAFPDERKLPLLHTFHEKISDPYEAPPFLHLHLHMRVLVGVGVAHAARDHASAFMGLR